MIEPHRIKVLADRVGFDRCGFTTAAPLPRGDFFRQWLENGFAGTMGYLHRHRDSRTDVRAWLPWARSVIVVALNYHQPAPALPKDEPRGRVAMYAWGEDYHVVLREKSEQLVARLRDEITRNDAGRPPDSGRERDEPRFQICVDTSAIIERELAAAAGIGWIGKNTLVLHPKLGSFFFLGAIITNLALVPDSPMTDHCGSCTRCLDACPTNAFVAPYVMDARRCISYLTIEHRAEPDPELTSASGDWLFGCDICQEVCPHNHHAPMTREERFRPAAPSPVDTVFPRLSDIAQWDEAAYQAAIRDRATERARLDMWQRNARIVESNLNRRPPE